MTSAANPSGTQMRHQTAMTCWLMAVGRPPCLRTPLYQQTVCSHSQKFSYQQLQEAPVVPQGPRHLQESLLSSTPAFRTLHPTRPPTTSTAMVELGQPPQQGQSGSGPAAPAAPWMCRGAGPGGLAWAPQSCPTSPSGAQHPERAPAPAPTASPRSLVSSWCSGSSGS